MSSVRRPDARVRDAMIAEPRALTTDDTARVAGEVLTPAEVRAVYVVDATGVLVGVSRARRSSRGSSPRVAIPTPPTLGDVAEPPYYTIDADTPLDEGYRFIEEHDAERVPVVDEGRLVGVLSRAVLQRRLAEDEEPPEPDEA